MSAISQRIKIDALRDLQDSSLYDPPKTRFFLGFGADAVEFWQ